MGLQTKKWLQFQEWRVHTYGPGHAILDGDRQGDLPTDSSTFLKMASTTGWLIRPTFLLLKYEQRDFWEELKFEGPDSVVVSTKLLLSPK